MKKNLDIITIDGPSGAGKGTIAKLVAKTLNYSYLDTGAMYRAVALAVKEAGIDPEDEKKIAELLKRISIKTIEDKIYLNNKEVEDQIRSESISLLASLIAKHKRVREALVKVQKDIASREKIVVEGRDMGTYVFPEARHKFYLDASLEERAKRRHKQLSQQGIEKSFDQVKHEIKKRDLQDMTRKESPLHPAPNAVIIDTTQLSIDEVVSAIVGEVRSEK